MAQNPEQIAQGIKKARNFSMIIIGNGTAFLQTILMLRARDITPVTNNDADFITIERLGLKPVKTDFSSIPPELLRESSSQIILVSSVSHTQAILKSITPAIHNGHVLLVVKNQKTRIKILHPYAYHIDPAEQFDARFCHRIQALIRLSGMNEYFRLKIPANQKSLKMLIVFFGPPDPDAIASSAAFARLYSKIAVTTFASTAKAKRFENRALLSYMKMNVLDISQVNLLDYQVIACFDAQPSFFKKAGYEIPFDICIDHHPEAPDNPPVLFSDIRKHHGSCSTILAQYFYYSGKPLPNILATALLLGIKTDTANFTRSAFEPDVNMMIFLNRKANRDILRRLEFSTIPKRALKYFKRAYNRLILEPNFLICNLGRVGYLDIGSIMADQFLKIQKVYLCMVSCIYREKIYVFVRSINRQYHAGEIAAKLFENSGTGGGHAEMGRAECLAEKLPYPVKNLESEILNSARKASQPKAGQT